MGSIIARNYGEALLNIAEENNSIKAYKEELQELYQVLKENQELWRVMDFPWVSKEDKKKIIRNLFSFDLYIMNFIELIIDKNRFSSLEDICQEFIEMANERLNVEVVEITSASELTEEELKEIKELLEKRLGNEIDLRTAVDSSYIAGMRLKIKDRVLDNTAISKLDAIRERVTKAVL